MIEQFQGKYRWLSNFSPLESSIIFGDISYITAEHFYVAMKTTDIAQRFAISITKNPGEVKRMGSQLILRPGWDRIRDDIMRCAIELKFSEKNPTLKQRLIDTGDVHIQEGNMWNDKYWGVCLKTGEGKNILGEIIMNRRDELIGE